MRLPELRQGIKKWRRRDSKCAEKPWAKAKNAKENKALGCIDILTFLG